ncbi:hypothetical protein PENTCL1PPCAC_4484, partial [Pristionchus entomophagus]
TKKRQRRPANPVRRHSSSASDSATGAEKKYQCPHCDNRYGKSSHLTPHIRKHLKLKPFLCNRDGCQKAFYTKDQLKRHHRGSEHDDIKDILCPVCHQGFRRHDNMREHKKRAHPNHYE